MTDAEARSRLYELRKQAGVDQGEVAEALQELELAANPTSTRKWRQPDIARRENAGRPKRDQMAISLDDLNMLAGLYGHEVVVDIVKRGTDRVPIELVKKPDRRALLAGLARVVDKLEDDERLALLWAIADPAGAIAGRMK